MLRVLLFLTLISFSVDCRRIKLSSVEVLTFNKGDWAATRRNKPENKLKCTRGCDERALPHSVQCLNKGSDGLDVNWECKANLNKKYRLGRTFVTCEGYDYPEDPFILYDSCFLEYELERTDKENSLSNDSAFQIVAVIFACFVMYLIYKSFIDPNGGSVTSDGYPTPPPYQEPSTNDSNFNYGWNVNSDNKEKIRTNENSSTSNYTGVFSHLVAGAAGYFAGRATSGSNNSFQRESRQRSRSPSSDRHVSETFASTRRR